MYAGDSLMTNRRRRVPFRVAIATAIVMALAGLALLAPPALGRQPESWPAPRRARGTAGPRERSGGQHQPAGREHRLPGVADHAGPESRGSGPPVACRRPRAAGRAAGTDHARARSPRAAATDAGQGQGHPPGPAGLAVRILAARRRLGDPQRPRLQRFARAAQLPGSRQAPAAVDHLDHRGGQGRRRRRRQAAHRPPARRAPDHRRDAGARPGAGRHEPAAVLA